MNNSERVEYPALTESLEEMPSKERVARMLEVNMAYAQCYMDGDFDGMLEYLIDVPVFEFYPQGMRLTGRDIVRERSRRLHEAVTQNDSRRAGDNHVITAATHGADVLIHEWHNLFTLPDGSSRQCHTIAVIPFVGDRMVGERVYSDHYLAAMRDEGLGEDFWELPGVERL